MASGMAEPGGYRTGQAEALLGIPEHVLRYWQKAIPFLEPRRSFGRRLYSSAELALLCRVRHLVRQHGLDLAAVRERLIAERGGPGAEQAAVLAEIRASLIDSFFALRRLSGR